MTMPPSLADLSAAATAGEWIVDDESDSDRVYLITTGLAGFSRYGVQGDWEIARFDFDFEAEEVDAEANARFLAACVSTIRAALAADPELVARLERVREAGK